MNELIQRLCDHKLLNNSTMTVEECSSLSGPQTLYVGFDPTSDSLHVGSLIPLNALRLASLQGHHIIVIIGTATAMIGDPSGKSAERTLLEKEIIETNALSIEKQIKKLLPEAICLRNGDWYEDIKWLDMLRHVGKHFSVNAMLRTDAVRDRLSRSEQGISFTEFRLRSLPSL